MSRSDVTSRNASKAKKGDYQKPRFAITTTPQGLRLRVWGRSCTQKLLYERVLLAYDHKAYYFLHLYW